MESTGAAPVCDAGDIAAPTSRAKVRARIAAALLLIGLVVAFVPGLAAGDAFLPGTWVISSPSVRIPFPIPSSPQPQRFVTASGGQLSIDTTGGVLWITSSAGVVVTGRQFGRSSLTDLVAGEQGWTAAVAALLAMAPLYCWWRRGSLSFGRVAGAATCVAAGAAVCALVLVRVDDVSYVTIGKCWTMPLGAALMAAAFVVAPAPVRRE